MCGGSSTSCLNASSVDTGRAELRFTAGMTSAMGPKSHRPSLGQREADKLHVGPQFLSATLLQ